MVPDVLRPLKVLIIVDDQELLNWISAVLAQRQIQPMGSVRALQGLDLAQSEEPNVILLGTKLPDLESLSVLRRLQ